MSKSHPKPSAPPVFSPDQARLKAIKGPYKGVSYKLVAGKITIGRSSENDIVLLDDSKCSRKQAIVNLNSDNSYSIKDLSNRASIKINNMAKIQSKLQDGDLIQLGSTVLQFELKKSEAPSLHSSNMPAPVPPAPSSNPVSMNPALATTPHNNLQPVPAQKPENNLLSLKQEESPSANSNQSASPNYGSIPYPSSPHLNRKEKKKKSLLPKIILITLVAAGIYLYLNDSENKKEKEDQLRTIMDREEDIKTLSELREKEQEKRNKNALISYKNAQFAYINGIRDYRKGVYSRAIESFRVCKTLYPQHDLCASYLKKAQIKNQQLIQAWMVAGKDYREKRRFVPCMSSFKNVMMAVKDKQNLTYKEAVENYKICQIQHEDRY